MNEYIKLKDLIGKEFTVTAVSGYKWKKWDPVQNKMLVSDSYEAGYRKLYQVTTDKGVVDMGSGQLGNLLEAVFFQGSADLINKTFDVKSNGKEGMDIRYFFNLKKMGTGLPLPKATVAASAPAFSSRDDLPPVENYNDIGLTDEEIDQIPF